MPQHQMYLNLGDNRWLTARCSCGRWERERMVAFGQRVSEVVRVLDEEFERHTGSEPTEHYHPVLPVE